MEEKDAAINVKLSKLELLTSDETNLAPIVLSE